MVFVLYDEVPSLAKIFRVINPVAPTIISYLIHMLKYESMIH